MKNIKNLKNTVVIKSKGILKLSNESSINNNSIKSKKMNPIALNLKNISSIKNSNNNIKKINPYNYSKIKNHSLNSDTNQTSKKIRRNLILRGNNIFRTFDNHSNSDSYSSTHNSSAKNFSETFRKFFLQNEDKKMSKNYSRNRKKNSILGGITNSYTYDTFKNENDKTNFPKINKNGFYFSPLTERDLEKNNYSKIENRHNYLSRNQTSTPVKLFLTNNDSSSYNNINNNYESPTVSNSTIPFLNKKLMKKTFENNNIISKKILKKPTLLRKLNKKKLSAAVLTVKGFNNQINRKIRKVKSIYYKENLNNIEEDNKEKLNYKSETETNNKSKIKEHIIIPENNKKQINRKSVPEYELGNQFAQLSNVNDTNLSRPIQKEGTLRKLGISNLFRKIENKNQIVNLYNTSSETDSEESYNSNNSEKVKSINLNKDNISNYFSSPIKLREKIINIPHEHLKKNMFENEIIDKLNEIDNKSFNKKINIVHNFQEKNYDLFCSYESNINKLFDKAHKKDKTKYEIKINLIFVKKQIFYHQKYESKYLKKLKKVRNNFKPINQHFIYNYLLEKYIPIDIYNEIYENKSLNQIKSHNYSINLFKNFSFLKNLIKTESEDFKAIKPIRKKNTKHLNITSKKNIFYMSRLCVYDYEYHIKGGVKIINNNIENKKTINYRFNDIKSRKKTTKGRATIKILLRKDTNKHHNINLKETKEIINKEKREKSYLTRALKKINFYKKSIKIFSKSKMKKYNISKTEKEIKLGKKEILENHNGYVNKYQMISRVTDLKMKMIENLESSETLFFHIKDRNYPLFKSIFEKFKMNPDLTDNDGNSLLSLAVQSNSFQIVNYLINAGASVNTQNKSNNTPLHFALSFHNFEIADMLIKSGANEKIQNKSGMTPWECLDVGVSII